MKEGENSLPLRHHSEGSKQRGETRLPKDKSYKLKCLYQSSKFFWTRRTLLTERNGECHHTKSQEDGYNEKCERFTGENAESFYGSGEIKQERRLKTLRTRPLMN